MSVAEPWISLGLAPTADVRAIRSAYAGKLKQIDVDADPDAFRSLREHHDWALHLARAMASETFAAPEDDHAAMIDTAAEANGDAASLPGGRQVATMSEPEAAMPGEPAEELDRYKMHIWQLLTDEKYGPWHGDRLAARTRALLDLPILENIEVTAETEHWLAAVIAQTMPRSDPIVEMAVHHFGWKRLEGKVGGFYGLHHALQRLKDMDCSQRLRQPDHRWHQAFLYLQQPPQASVSAEEKRKIGNHINGLLESIRFHNPTVEAELNAEHVAQWDGFIGEAVQEEREIKPIRSSAWKDIFGLIPIWGWLVILNIVALIFGS